MKAGRMYRIKNLSSNRQNTCMRLANRWQPNGRLNDIRELVTEQPQWANSAGKTYQDGDVVACVGVHMRETHHYEKQPFYKILTLTGEVGYVSKGTRNKYFELVR
jgi:hypothetical protein